jgi:excisionase family DNA binding protein
MAQLDRSDENTEGYVTVAQAARTLGVGRKVVYQLIEYGRIRSQRKRQVLLVDKESLDVFRRSGELT